MKPNDNDRFLVLLILAAMWASGFLTAKAVGSELDEWCQEDKALHFAGGAAIGATTYALVQTVAPDLAGWKKHAVAIGVSALVGVVKEYCDALDPEDHTCDARDALATVGGGVLGSVSVSLVFRF